MFICVRVCWRERAFTLLSTLFNKIQASLPAQTRALLSQTSPDGGGSRKRPHEDDSKATAMLAAQQAAALAYQQQYGSMPQQQPAQQGGYQASLGESNVASADVNAVAHQQMLLAVRYIPIRDQHSFRERARVAHRCQTPPPLPVLLSQCRVRMCARFKLASFTTWRFLKGRFQCIRVWRTV